MRTFLPVISILKLLPSVTRNLTALVSFFALFVILLVPASATKIQRVISASGIEAWLVEDHTLPLISMQFAFAGGSSQNPAGKEGLSSLVASLVDEGSADLDSQAYQGRLQELAIRLSFSSSRDHIEGQVKTLTENADVAFHLLHTALTEPHFDEEPVERIRAQILTGLKQSEKNPNSIAGRTWFKLAFGDHPYSHPVAGNIDAVVGITADDMRAYVARIFSRQSLKIAVVGDITSEQLALKLDEIFGDLPDTPTLSAIPIIEPAEGPVRQIIALDIPQTIIIFGHKGFARADPDFIPAYIVNYILGGGSFSSRLYEEVREKRGLAYSVYTYLQPLDYSALFMGGVATQNERAGESLATIEEEIKRLATEGPTEQELAHAKSFLIGSYNLRFDTSDKIANQLVGIQLSDLGIDYIDNRNGLIEAIGIEDVKRVARRLLSSDALLVTIVGQPVGIEEINPGG